MFRRDYPFNYPFLSSFRHFVVHPDESQDSKVPFDAPQQPDANALLEQFSDKLQHVLNDMDVTLQELANYVHPSAEEPLPNEVHPSTHVHKQPSALRSSKKEKEKDDYHNQSSHHHLFGLFSRRGTCAVYTPAPLCQSDTNCPLRIQSNHQHRLESL